VRASPTRSEALTDRLEIHSVPLPQPSSFEAPLRGSSETGLT
jgi:hypothetical protein